jgi:hypothetical protein
MSLALLVAVERAYSWLNWYRRDVVRRRADETLLPNDLRDAFTSGFAAGGSYALRKSADIAGLRPTLDLFNDLLAAELDQRVKEAEPGLHPDPARSPEGAPRA